MALAGGGGAAAAATGAAAGAATALTAGGALQTIGAVATIAAPILSGVVQAQTARTNARLIENQRKTEAALNAVKDNRERRRFFSAMRQQSAELAGRGVQLDSPAAIMLGESAATELAFNSQSIRSSGQARDTELSDSAMMLRARAGQSIFMGGLGAASSLLTVAPDVWPELLG